MAYFDSTKNRALWEIELAALRKERAARAAGKTGAVVEADARQRQMTGKEPIRMTYQELLREEANASPKSAHSKEPSRAAVRERQKEMPAYEKK